MFFCIMFCIMKRDVRRIDVCSRLDVVDGADDDDDVGVVFAMPKIYID